MGNNPNGFGARTTAEQVASGIDLKGKVVLVTGGNGGIGLEACRVFASHGAHVVIAARDQKRGQDAVDELKKQTNSEAVELLPLDLSDLASAQKAAETFKSKHKKLDVLLCNAGIMGPDKLQKSVQGYENQFATNHLGHFVLTNLLLEPLKAAGGTARVVVLSSLAHKSGTLDLSDINYEKHSYGLMLSYGRSKLCNLLFAREFDRRFQGQGIRANAVHPGVILTNLFNNMTGAAVFNVVARPFTKSIAQGAATSVFCSIHPSLNDVGGNYYADCWTAETSTLGKDLDLAKTLWEKSEEICADYLKTTFSTSSDDDEKKKKKKKKAKKASKESSDDE